MLKTHTKYFCPVQMRAAGYGRRTKDQEFELRAPVRWTAKSKAQISNAIRAILSSMVQYLSSSIQGMLRRSQESM